MSTVSLRSSTVVIHTTAWKHVQLKKIFFNSQSNGGVGQHEQDMNNMIDISQQIVHTVCIILALLVQ